MGKYKKIVIYGASSKIAQETAKNFKSDENIVLSGRDMGKLEIVRDDLKARNNNLKIFLFELEALDYDNHNMLFDFAKEKMGGLDCVLVAHGTLPDNDAIRHNPKESLKHFEINCNSAISLSTIAAKIFEEQNSGCLAVISSVAGERGRQSNYIYGAAKSGLTQFLGGLRNRLKETNVNVLTIKPGPVDTPMTKDMKKGLLFAKADAVGKKIYSSIQSGKDVLYVPGIWKLIMTIIKAIPESIFKKMSM